MNNKFVITAGILLATTAISTAQAVEAELYGQVNKVLTSTDNGNKTEVTMNDNINSSTRIGFKGMEKLDNGLTASVLIEYQLATDGSSGDLMATSSSTAATLGERHARAGLSGDFGTVMVGHTSPAFDGIIDIDMAGVGNLIYAEIVDIGGNTSFVQKSGTTAAVKVKDVFNAFDQDRVDGVFYSSPWINGVQGMLSVVEGGNIQFGADYHGSFDGFKVKARAGYEIVNNSTGTTTDLESNTLVAVSVKHDSGVAATFNYGTEGRESGPEFSSYYVKLGYDFKNGYEIATDYSHNDSDDALNTEANSYSVGAQYNMGHGVSLATAYRKMTVEKDARDYEDLDLIMANLRVKF